MERIRTSQAARGLFAIAILLALFVRILAPTGFMPDTAYDRLVVQLCHGSEVTDATILIDRKAPTDKKSCPDGFCPFSLFSIHALPIAPSAIVSRIWVVPTLDVATWPIAFAIINQLASPPPPAIGPPAAS